MRVPLSWVGEFVDLSGIAPEEVARLLTVRTCEVDAVLHVGAGLEKILVGQVVSATKHPGADALRITRVDVGMGDLLPIVCGAPNVAVGQRVAVAVPGTKLPSGLEIGERKIRGETSRGMICSDKELGLGDDGDGILVLENDAKVGAHLVSLASIQDCVLEIDNKSINHRPDLWGLVGFARELRAILGRDGGAPEYAPLHRPNVGAHFPVEIRDDERCPRYLAGVFEGVRVGPSPAWMQRRLKLVGARPISNVVDVSNYVMFELGQPTHAFDRARIRGLRIVVRTARDGETLVTLDGAKRALAATDLVIADAEGAVGIAGVMGGANSEVSAETSALVLESATFQSATVRRTAARLGLRSEASARFEKTLDVDSACAALSRIASLAMHGLLGPNARLAAPVTSAGKGEARVRSIPLSWSFVADRLGVSVEAALGERREWAELLRRLEMSVEGEGDQVRVTVPSFRATKDVTEPIDLVEEIARLRGYEKVMPRPLEAQVVPPPEQGNRRLLVRRVEDRLAALGFRSLETYSFLADATIDALKLEGPFVTVKNAIVTDQSRVRRDLMPSLLALVDKNAALEPDLRLFEIGKGYRPERPRRDAYVGAERGEPEEAHHVAAVIASPIHAPARFDDTPFHRAKGFAASLLEGLDLEAEPGDAGAPAAGADPMPYLHPRRREGVRAGGRELGLVGELHPEAAARLGLKGLAVAGFELDLAALEEAVAAAGPRKLKPIPRFPGVTVDVALAAPASIPVAELAALVRAADATLCRSVELFDVYEGAELGAGKRSVAFHVELRADDKTLTDADAAAFLKRVAAAAASREATLRGWQG